MDLICEKCFRVWLTYHQLQKKCPWCSCTTYIDRMELIQKTLQEKCHGLQGQKEEIAE